MRLLHLEFRIDSALRKHLEILSRELEARVQKNTRYSLRAYAKFLGLHSSALSRVMSGKLEMTSETGVKIAKRLKLSEDETRVFIHSILQSRSARELAKVGKLLEIELHPIATRAVVEKTVSVDPTKVPHAHQRIVEFVEKLSEEVACENRAHVYQLGISFYPVTTVDD